MALNPSNSRNLFQLALKGLTVSVIQSMFVIFSIAGARFKLLSDIKIKLGNYYNLCEQKLTRNVYVVSGWEIFFVFFAKVSRDLQPHAGELLSPPRTRDKLATPDAQLAWFAVVLEMHGQSDLLCSNDIIFTQLADGPFLKTRMGSGAVRIMTAAFSGWWS